MPAGASGASRMPGGAAVAAAPAVVAAVWMEALAPPESNSPPASAPVAIDLLDDDGRGDGAENNPEAHGGDADGLLQVGQRGSRVNDIQSWGRS